MMDITPLFLLQVLGFGIGLLAGESFARFDYMIKHKSEWYKKLAPFWKWFVAGLLDILHHWQYGAVLILFVQLYPNTPDAWGILLTWLGIGLIVSDWKDWEYIIKRMPRSAG